MDTTLILSMATIFLMVLCILFAGFLWTVDSKNRLSNRLLAAMLIVITISISAFWYGFYFEIPLSLDRIRDDINILSSPLLFLFIYAALHRDFRLKYVDLLHFIPLILVTLVIVPRFYLANHDAQVIFINNYFAQPEVRVSNVIRFVTPVIYYIWAYVILYRAKQLILENHSDDKIKLYDWLWQLNTLSLFIFLVSLTKGILRFHVTDDVFQLVRLSMVLVLIGFLIWLVMKALHHPNLFRGLGGSLVSVHDLLQSKKGQEPTAGSDNIATELARIQKYMTEHEPYLESNLSLENLARRLNVPPHELSLQINHQLGKHFFNFVNEYRIRKAQQILIDPSQKAKTVLEVLYEVGFNSKSSFNTAFKKHTDMTPTEYRKNFS